VIVTSTTPAALARCAADQGDAASFYLLSAKSRRGQAWIDQYISGSREPDCARIVDPHDVKDILARAHAECLGILIIPEPRHRGALPPTKEEEENGAGELQTSLK
jgi:hypothetical protein